MFAIASVIHPLIFLLPQSLQWLYKKFVRRYLTLYLQSKIYPQQPYLMIVALT